MCDKWVSDVFLPSLKESLTYRVCLGYDTRNDFLSVDEEDLFQKRLLTRIKSGATVTELFMRRAIVLFCTEFQITNPFVDMASEAWLKTFLPKHPFLYVSIYPERKPQGEEACDWVVETDDELNEKYIETVETGLPLDQNTEIIDLDANGFLMIRNRKASEKQSGDVKIGYWWWRNRRGFVVGNSVGYYSNMTPQQFASSRLAATQYDILDESNIEPLLKRQKKQRGCSIAQELKEGLQMDPEEAGDVGLPCANEAVAKKGKVLTRRLMKSRCANVPPNVKVKGETMKRIVATLVNKFKTLRNQQHISPTPFLTVKHKHAELLYALFVEAPGEVYKMSELYKVYADAIEKGDHTYDPANFGLLIKLIFSSRVQTRQTSDKDRTIITLVTGLKAKGIVMEQHYIILQKQLFERYVAKELEISPKNSIRTTDAYDCFIRFLRKEKSELNVNSHQFGIMILKLKGVTKSSRYGDCRLYKGIGFKQSPVYWDEKAIFNNWVDTQVVVNLQAPKIEMTDVLQSINERAVSLGVNVRLTPSQFCQLLKSRKSTDQTISQIHSTRPAHITYYHNLQIRTPTTKQPTRWNVNASDSDSE